MGGNQHLVFLAPQCLCQLQPDLVGHFRGGLAGGKALVAVVGYGAFLLAEPLFDGDHLISGGGGAAIHPGHKPLHDGHILIVHRNLSRFLLLDKKEAEAFNKKVKRSGLSREVYLRHLINGLVPQDAPPPAYFDFIRELHGIGNNLNQIAQKAHVLGVIDERRYEEETRKFDQLIRDITRAVILPKPME